MDYSQFIVKMQERVRETLGAGLDVEPVRVRKNNGVVLQGLTLRKAGGKVVPTIYLEKFYEDYLAGKDIEDILGEFVELYEQQEDMPIPELECFGDYAQVRNSLAVKLISRERNAALLAEVPHRDFLDLSIVFHYLLNSPAMGQATVLIKNTHLEMWNIGTDTLCEDALKNAEKMLPGNIRTIDEIITRLLLEDREAFREWRGMEKDLFPKLDGFLEGNGEKKRIPLLILTNSRRYYGASCILYEELLKKFAGELGDNFFILPSSVHEVILLPEIYVDNVKKLFRMVSEVNRTQLEPEEVLSDSIYYYDRKDGKIRIYEEE